MRQLEGRDVITCAGVTALAVALLEWLARYVAAEFFPEGDVGQALPILFKWVLMLAVAAYIPARCYRQIAGDARLIWRGFIPVAAVAGLASALCADPELTESLARAEVLSEAAGTLAAQFIVRTLVFLVAMMAGSGLPGRESPHAHTWWGRGHPAMLESVIEDEVKAAIERARQAYEAGNLALAETEYRKALQMDPNSAEAHLGLGYVSIYLGKRDTAQWAFDRVLRMGTDDAKAHAGMGWAAWYRGQPDVAREQFDRALELDDRCTQALVGLGRARLLRGEYQEALPLFERATHGDPDNANAHEGLGGCYLGLGRHLEAVAELDRAIELTPAYADAYYRRGLAYSEVGDRERALADWAQALALAPRAWFAEELRGELEGGDGIDGPDQV